MSTTKKEGNKPQIKYCSYKSIQYGQNIYFSKTTDDDIDSLTLSVSGIKRNNVMIFAKNSEIDKIYPKKLLVVPSEPISLRKYKNKWNQPSGYVLLCCAVMGSKTDTDTLWKEED